MKFLGALIILTAAALFGSAFFGVWTPPGLEGLPTVESLGRKRAEKTEEAVEQESGIFPMGSGPFLPKGISAVGQHTEQLQQAGRQISPDS